MSDNIDDADRLVLSQDETPGTHVKLPIIQISRRRTSDSLGLLWNYLILRILTPFDTCRWYFDFQLQMVKRVPNSRGNLRTVKTYTVVLVYRRNLVTKVYFVNTVMCSVSFVYVFHLTKFVSFCCYRIFRVNKDIH